MSRGRKRTLPSTGDECSKLPSIQYALMGLAKIHPLRDGCELDFVIRRSWLLSVDGHLSRSAPSDTIRDMYEVTIDYEMVRAWFEMEVAFNRLMRNEFARFQDSLTTGVMALLKNRQAKEETRFHDSLFCTIITRMCAYIGQTRLPDILLTEEDRAVGRKFFEVLGDIEQQILAIHDEVPRPWSTTLEMCRLLAAR